MAARTRGVTSAAAGVSTRASSSGVKAPTNHAKTVVSKVSKTRPNPTSTSKSNSSAVKVAKPVSPRTRRTPAAARLDVDSASIKTSSTPKSTPKSTPHKNKAPSMASPSSLVRKKYTSSIITEQDILDSYNNQELVEFINSLVHTKHDDLFTKYETKVKAQLKNDHELINQLHEEVSEKQSTIDKLLQEVDQLKATAAKPSISTKVAERDFINDIEYQSPIRSRKHKSIDIINQESIKKEFEDIGFTLDMLELLTGLRITNFTEDDEKYYFDVKQSSSSSTDVVYITYRLVISKSFESSAEIDYIPTFLEALENEEDENENDDNDDDAELTASENAKYLKSILPEYLCENLSFPYNTLSQFYAKVNRALHKGNKV